MTEYTEIVDPRLQERVCKRYSGEIAILQALGFEKLAYKLETLEPFSAVSRLPIVLLMRAKGEVLTFPFPLRLACGHPLLVHSEPSSIADCMGMGVKFYTNFSDHSLLISSTLQSHIALQDDVLRTSSLRIVRNYPSRTPEEAWLSHKRRTKEMEVQGKTFRNTSTFADYVDISRREELDLKSRGS